MLKNAGHEVVLAFDGNDGLRQFQQQHFDLVICDIFMLLHYTAMHTQPWHPFPKDYAYRHHPLGEVWYRLERAADDEGYQVFTRERPSPQFREVVAQYGRSTGDETVQPALPAAAANLAAALEVRSVLQLDMPTIAAHSTWTVFS